jgi:EmrB/QacA subfamily drug resistance transporter
MSQLGTRSDTERYGTTAEAAPGRPIPKAAWAAAWVMALGGFLGNMDGPIVAVGLESMRVSLHVSLAAIQWVATAYLLGLSAALPLTPWLVRRLGSGRAWLCALAAFVLTSAGCALAPTAVLLIGARTAQGMTAGVLVAAGQTVIGEAVGPARLGRMMATLGLVVGLAPVVGPSVGGLLLAWSSWPALFWLNAPVGGLALLLGWRFVPRGDRQRPPPMDWLGLVLISLGLPVLVYALTELGAPGRGPALPFAVLLGVGVGASTGFVWWSWRAAHPVLALRLVTRPMMAAGLLSVLLGGASMVGSVLLLPLWFQIRLGEGPASTGLLLVSTGLGTVAVMLVAGRLTDHYGRGVIALAGSLLVLGSTVPFPWLGPHPAMPLVQALLVLRGAGLGLSVMPAMTAASASVRPGELGDATALANIAMRVGGAVGSALCVIVLSRGLDAAGPSAGFASAFLALTFICLFATVAAAWLRRSELRQHQTLRSAERKATS